MSKYTTELRWIIEQELDNKHLEHSEENWRAVYKKIGLDDYPIFDEKHRDELNHKIIRRYYFREIGFETCRMFSWKLRELMFEIMPYYNKLYESELLEIDPLRDYMEIYEGEWASKNTTDRDITENEDTDFSSDSENDGTSATKTTFHDTPMSMLDDEEPTQIQMMKWATNVTYENQTTHDEGTLSSTRDRDRTQNEDVEANGEGTSGHTLHGYRHGQAELLMKYRETFLNIDEEIVNRCNQVFFKLW